MITIALVEVGDIPVTRMLDNMLRQLHEFPEKKMGPEMTEWQAQDMHRTYPWTEVHGKRVHTVIWPRGQTEGQRAAAEAAKAARAALRELKLSKRARTRYLRQKRRVRRITRKTYQSAKRRPILREELFDMLVARMTGLLGEVHWR